MLLSAADYEVCLISLRVTKWSEGLSQQWEGIPCDCFVEKTSVLMHANIFRLIALPEVFHGSLGVLKWYKNGSLVGDISGKLFWLFYLFINIY